MFIRCHKLFWLHRATPDTECFATSQVRAVPIRKDDEVQIVRGTYKVSA